MAALPLVVAADVTDLLSAVPWSFVMAFASLGLIFLLFRKRPGLFDELGFSGQEVALLTLGSIAGWAVNLPLAVFGGTYLALNLGGTLVPLLLIGWWIRKRKLPLVLTLVGTTVVALTAWRIVEFHPESGIVARYPTFFLPVLVAFVFAVVVSLRDPIRGVPVGYASGTLGALIGADLLHIQDIRAHFAVARENTIISIGGAGVFDMVFLAGTFAMALHLGLIVLLRLRAPAPMAAGADYPTTGVTLRDSRRVQDSFRRLEQPNGLDRALAGIAMSNLALREGDYGRSVRMSWLAVDSLLHVPDVESYLGNGVPLRLREDLRLLQARSQDARVGGTGLKDAGEANTAAKILVSALAPRANLRHNLEGVA